MPSWRSPIPSLITSFVIIYQLISGVLLAKCPSSWISSDGTCIKAFEIVKDYPDAKAYCYRQGGTLANVTEEKESHVKELIGNLQQKDAPFWVALDKSESRNIASGFAEHGHWPLEIEFEYHGDDKVCVKLKPGDEGYVRDSCSQESPYFCEVYVGNQGVCPKGWELYHREDSCIGYFAQLKTWGQSLSDCTSFGGDLVQIWNKEKLYFITDMNTTRTLSAWIGIWMNNNDGTYRFIDNIIIEEKCHLKWELGDVIPGKDSSRCLVVGKRQRGLVKEDCHNTHYFFCQIYDPGSSCSPPWYRIDRDTCVNEYKTLKTWEDAHVFCKKALLGELVLIESQQMLDILTGVRSVDDQVYWIENNDMDGDGVWEWKYNVLDHPISLPDQPETDNVDGYCVVVGNNYHGLQWDNCNEQHYFFCESLMDIHKGCYRPLSFRYLDEKLCVEEFKLNLTWYQAREFCLKDHGRRLAVVKTADQLDFLIDNVRISVHVDHWIYNGYIVAGPIWKKVLWENLFPSTPTIPNDANPKKDNCVRMEAMDYGFKRTSCDSLYYFICEKDMENNRCPSSAWTPYSRDMVCIKSYNVAKNYLAARAYCRKCCRDLVEIRDIAKRNFVRDVARMFALYPYWIGFYTDRDFVTESRKYSETKWPLPMSIHAGTEDNAGDCMSLVWRVNSYYIEDCRAKLYYVCEKPRAFRGYCDPGWNLYEKENVCIKVFDDKKVTFKGANVKCRSQDAEVVSIWNNEKEFYIKEVYAPKIFAKHEMDLWTAMRRDPKGKFTMGSKTIIPVNPAKLKFSDIALIGSSKTDSCVVVGQFDTGLIRSECTRSHYIMCEKLALWAKCSDGWSLYREEFKNWCIKAFDKRDNWKKSNYFCDRQGGHLVDIKTMHKLKFVRVKRLENSDRVYWTGFKDTNGDGVLEHPDEELYFPPTSNAPPWQNPFEVRDKNECVKIEGDQESEYTARGCDSKNYFICEKDPHRYDDL